MFMGAGEVPAIMMLLHGSLARLLFGGVLGCLRHSEDWWYLLVTDPRTN